MKRYLIYILLIISSVCYGQIYKNRIYGTISTPTYNNYRNINGGSNIGYSSPNIGYSTYKYGMTNTYNMYERQYNNVYRGTHNPGSRSSGRPGRPRKVKGYTADGDSINTDGMGNPSDPSKGMWLDDYNYYYEDGYWYRGHYDWRNRYVYEKWSSLFDLDKLLWNWYGGRNPGDDAIQYYKNNPKPHPYDPNPTPIGEFPIGLLLILSFLFVYKKFKNKLIEL